MILNHPELKEIRQSEFASLHNLNRVEVAALRKSNLREGEWRIDGRVIWWTDEAADRIAAIIAGEGIKPTSPALALIAVRVIQQARNPRFVYADLDGQRIAVAVPQKIAAKLKGKTINVIATDGADETLYTYQP